MGYRIASFNMRNFGLKAITNRDFNKIAEIIQQEKFDIVAMQEILAEGKGVAALLKQAMGPKWELAVSDISYDSDPRGEQYAYIWNTKRVRPVETHVWGRTRVFEPHILNSGNGNEIRVDCSRFVRIPYYARFEPVNGPFFEFRLINVHLYFGDNTLSEIQKRQKEYKVLTEEVYPAISTLRKYGNNRPAVTIALGDYNLNIYRPRGEAEKWINKNTYLAEVYQYEDRNVSQKIETVQYELTTLKNKETDMTSDDNASDCGYSQNYDHFTLDTMYMNNTGIKYKYKRIDAVRVYCEDDFGLYREKISDHIPIVIEINF